MNSIEFLNSKIVTYTNEENFLKAVAIKHFLRVISNSFTFYRDMKDIFIFAF